MPLPSVIDTANKIPAELVQHGQQLNALLTKLNNDVVSREAALQNIIDFNVANPAMVDADVITAAGNWLTFVQTLQGLLAQVPASPDL